jgi:hypothetical protein
VKKEIKGQRRSRINYETYDIYFGKCDTIFGQQPTSILKIALSLLDKRYYSYEVDFHLSRHCFLGILYYAMILVLEIRFTDVKKTQINRRVQKIQYKIYNTNQ